MPFSKRVRNTSGISCRVESNRKLELHEVITEGTMEEPGDAGRSRRPDEPITVLDISNGQVLHSPPDANELSSRIDALCAFANESAGDAFIHPVVRAIVLHFALAYDHLVGGPQPLGGGRALSLRRHPEMSLARFGHELRHDVGRDAFLRPRP